MGLPAGEVQIRLKSHFTLRIKGVQPESER
jgi:hypothetical protein